jgi:hypothetical protein
MRSPSILLAGLLAVSCVGCGSDDPSDGAIAESATATTAATVPVEAPPEGVEQCTDLGGELASELRDGDLVHCLGGELLAGTAVESTAVDHLDTTGWSVQLTFAEGADGIDAFNAAAIECFNGSPICPSRQLAVVVAGRVVTAPTINAPAFERDQIILAGAFEEDEANRIAGDLIGAGSFRPVLFSVPTAG